MEQKERYTLGANERLKSRKAIDLLFKQGKSFSLFPFRVVYQKSVADSGEEILQAAFSVSKRYFKKAVYRNRIKRLMREAYRLQKNELQHRLQQSNRQMIIFIMYTGNELPEHSLVKEKIATVIKRLQKLSNEEPAANT
ncbi:MAG: ribonuclease P protein component [Chitinophagaceae bacterium]|nr:ribonuclease P protein component [Chitinophagaceae bacterium]